MGVKQINLDTPIAMLTVGQLQEALNASSSPSDDKSMQKEKYREKQYVYGLRGISELFNVSHPTAQRYKNTFLKPAIIQNGRKIIVDVDLAFELFAGHKR